MYAKIETERLNFIRHNQSKLRAENYVHLKNAMCKGDGKVSEVGKIVVLSSSFTGGLRYMHERTQDAMTYVRYYGRPDLILTLTSNRFIKNVFPVPPGASKKKTRPESESTLLITS